jgi:cytochrome b pre-mRNA-processing protein 3
MANAFYGRLRAYRAAGDEAALAEALLRNLYRGDSAGRTRASRLARYATVAQGRLDASDVVNGVADFGPLPEGVA